MMMMMMKSRNQVESYCFFRVPFLSGSQAGREKEMMVRRSCSIQYCLLYLANWIESKRDDDLYVYYSFKKKQLLAIKYTRSFHFVVYNNHTTVLRSCCFLPAWLLSHSKAISFGFSKIRSGTCPKWSLIALSFTKTTPHLFHTRWEGIVFSLKGLKFVHNDWPWASIVSFSWVIERLDSLFLSFSSNVFVVSLVALLCNITSS